MTRVTSKEVWSSLSKKGKWLVGYYGICGFLLVVLAIAIRAGIMEARDRGIEDAIIVDSTTHGEFEDWRTNIDPDDAQFFQKYTFFSLTNGQNVATKGAAPVAEEIGPLVYRDVQNKTLDSIVFADTSEGQTVTYKISRELEFIAERTLVSEDDSQVTLVNPWYVELVRPFGSENGWLDAIIGGGYADTPDGSIFNAVEAELTSAEFVTRAIDNWIPRALLSDWDTAVAYYTANPAGGATAEEDACTLFNGGLDPTVAGVSTEFVSNVGTVSTVNCQSIFDSATDGAMTRDANFRTNWINEDTSAVAIAVLTQSLGIDEALYNDLKATYLTNYRTQAEGFMLASVGAANTDEIGYIQWRSGTVLLAGGELSSISTVEPFASNLAAKFPASTTPLPRVEAPLDATAVDALSVAQVQSIFSNLDPARDGSQTGKGITNFVAIAASTSDESATLAANWNSISQAAVVEIAGGDNYESIVTGIALPYSQSIDTLISTRTARNWLFSSTDNSFYTDSTLSEDYTIYTGAGNLQNINKWVQYDGQTEITEWTTITGSARPISGGEGRNFPFPLDQTSVDVYVEELGRSVVMNYASGYQFKDIDCNYFKLSGEAFAVNPSNNVVYTGIQDAGFLNNGIPFAYSLPRFLNVDPAAVTAQGSWEDETDDQAELDTIEPFVCVQPETAASIYGGVRIQTNYLWGKTSEGFPEFQRTGAGLNTLADGMDGPLYIPLLWRDRLAEVSDQIADDIWWFVIAPDNGSLATMVIMFFVAIIHLVAGFVNFGRAYNQAQKLADPAYGEAEHASVDGDKAMSSDEEFGGSAASSASEK